MSEIYLSHPKYVSFFSLVLEVQPPTFYVFLLLLFILFLLPEHPEMCLRSRHPSKYDINSLHQGASSSDFLSVCLAGGLCQ